MHTQSTYPYASAIAFESGWTSFLVLKLNSLFLYNIWRPNTYLCTYGKKLYIGIGMLTIELGKQSALSKGVVFCGKT